ncbi:MAG: hypothetical protein EOR06_04085 [Mesorhizobium sp.]|nr:MAG: hypothetical protein EOR06_04085 [Mesorhizobium sp.]
MASGLIQAMTVESFPSPLVGEGGLAKRGRMRGVPGNANVSLRWNTPQPSRRCAPIHLLPQGEKGRRYFPGRPVLPGRRFSRRASAGSS